MEVQTINGGLMSDVDICEAIRNNEMMITPFDVPDKIEDADKRLTPSGFNFSFSRFIVSLNKGRFYPIIERNDELYFTIQPGDTALTLTQESIWVSKNIGGTFHSKVKYVAQGLGNVSTTLDPGWRGQLLIAINNPSSEPIEILIGKKEQDKIIYETFITLYLYKLNSPSKRDSDNEDSRLIDLNVILQKEIYKNENSKLLKIISEMISFMSEQRIPDLNHSDNLESDIEVMCSKHIKVLEEWEKKFGEIEIENLKIIKRRKHVFSIYMFILVAIIAVVIWCIFAFTKENDTRGLITMIITFLGVPVAEMLFTHLKEKYL